MDDNLDSSPSTGTIPVITLPYKWTIGLSILNGIFAFIGTIGNVLVLIAISKSRQLKSSPDMFITSLACADLLVSAVRQTLLIYRLNHFTESFTMENLPVYVTLERISNIGSPATLTCMLAVTVDRLIAIRRPLKYLQYCTRKKVIIVICSCWLVSTLLATMLNTTHGRYVQWTVTVICVLATLMIYFYIFLIAKKQESRVIAVGSAEEAVQEGSRPKQERKAAKTIASVVGVYVLFYFPFVIYAIAQSDLKGLPFFPVGFYLFYSLLLCNSAVNPFIYCARSGRYRKAIKELLTRKPL